MVLRVHKRTLNIDEMKRGHTERAHKRLRQGAQRRQMTVRGVNLLYLVKEVVTQMIQQRFKKRRRREKTRSFQLWTRDNKHNKQNKIRLGHELHVIFVAPDILLHNEVQRNKEYSHGFVEPLELGKDTVDADEVKGTVENVNVIGSSNVPIQFELQ